MAKGRKIGGRKKGTRNRATLEGRLTPKQERFVSEYLKDLNGAAAAVRAGYSPKTADRQAYALLRKPEISKVLAAAETQRLEENKVSATGPKGGASRWLRRTRPPAMGTPIRS
jgi:hypothetical protein